jgi:hypothetical protein
MIIVCFYLARARSSGYWCSEQNGSNHFKHVRLTNSRILSLGVDIPSPTRQWCCQWSIFARNQDLCRIACDQSVGREINHRSYKSRARVYDTMRTSGMGQLTVSLAPRIWTLFLSKVRDSWSEIYERWWVISRPRQIRNFCTFYGIGPCLYCIGPNKEAYGSRSQSSFRDYTAEKFSIRQEFEVNLYSKLI